MKKTLATLLAILLLALPMAAFGVAPDAAGGFTSSAAGGSYTYTLPKERPQHDYYREAFSTAHEFRDIYITQYGEDKAVVYDYVAHVMIAVLYNDTLGYETEVYVSGFNDMADVMEINSAILAVGKDMPFLSNLLFVSAGGSGHNYKFMISRSVSNYFSDDAPVDNASFIAMRDAVIAELNAYRAAVAGVNDAQARLEIAGKQFTAGATYDKKAPYHAFEALLNKRGVCGSANWAFSIVANAVDVPAYHLHIVGANHAATMVRPDGGQLMVIDVTFGIKNPKVVAISGWKHRDKVDWSRSMGFMESHYFPDVAILEHLGGRS